MTICKGDWSGNSGCGRCGYSRADHFDNAAFQQLLEGVAGYETRSYIGRGMREDCLGVVIPRGQLGAFISTVMAAVAEGLASARTENHAGPHAALEAFRAMQTDDMGEDTIVYFPGTAYGQGADPALPRVAGAIESFSRSEAICLELLRKRLAGKCTTIRIELPSEDDNGRMWGVWAEGAPFFDGGDEELLGAGSTLHSALQGANDEVRSWA